MNWCGMNGWREQLAGKMLWPVGGLQYNQGMGAWEGQLNKLGRGASESRAGRTSKGAGAQKKSATRRGEGTENEAAVAG